MELKDLRNFSNHVSFPTHISSHSLDLVLAPIESDYVEHVEPLPIDNDISDHALIIFSLGIAKPQAVRKSISFRSYRNVNTDHF